MKDANVGGELGVRKRVSVKFGRKICFVPMGLGLPAALAAFLVKPANALIVCWGDVLMHC